jgi:hypothetical protein
MNAAMCSTLNLAVVRCTAAADAAAVVQIVSAARDPLRSPVLVFGEPGLCKDNVATLLHFGGPDKFRIMVQVRLGCGMRHRCAVLHGQQGSTGAAFPCCTTAVCFEQMMQLQRLLVQCHCAPKPLLMSAAHSGTLACGGF